MSQIDEDLKKQVLGHKHMPKFVPGIKATYWKPVARIDAAVATMNEGIRQIRVGLNTRPAKSRGRGLSELSILIGELFSEPCLAPDDVVFGATRFAMSVGAGIMFTILIMSRLFPFCKLSCALCGHVSDHRLRAQRL